MFVAIRDEDVAAAVGTYARHGIATAPSGMAGLATLTMVSFGPDDR